MLQSKHKRHFVIAIHLLSESALDSIATEMKPWGKLLTEISGFSMTDSVIENPLILVQKYFLLDAKRDLSVFTCTTRINRKILANYLAITFSVIFCTGHSCLYLLVQYRWYRNTSIVISRPLSCALCRYQLVTPKSIFHLSTSIFPRCIFHSGSNSLDTNKHSLTVIPKGFLKIIDRTTAEFN